MRITIKNIEHLVERLNAEYMDDLRDDLKIFKMDHNTTYDYPYRLQVVYKDSNGTSNIGDRKSAREMYYFLKGLLKDSFWSYIKGEN